MTFSMISTDTMEMDTDTIVLMILPDTVEEDNSDV